MKTKIIIVLFLILSQISYSQYGTLTSFQGSLFQGISTGRSITFLPNGKVLFAGNSDVAPIGDKFIGFARNNENGSRDITFGTNGMKKLRVKNASFSSFVSLKKIDENNFYLVSVYGRQSVTKLNSDCIVDTNFGTNGTFDLIYGYSFNADVVETSPDGSFTATGKAKQTSAGPIGTVIGKYHADTTMDSSFGTNGFLFLDLSDIPGVSNDFTAGTAYPLSDGKYLVMGPYVFTDTGNIQRRNFFLKKFNADGSVDETYGTNGKTLTNVISSSFKTVVSGDGNVTVLGNPSTTFPNIASSGIRTVRFDSNGNFINEPSVYFGAGLPNPYIYNVIQQEDGKVIFAGSYINDLALNNTDSFVCRRMPDGTNDTTFGNNGTFTASFGDNESIQRIAIDSTGRIVFVGTRTANGYAEFTMGRLTTGVTLGAIRFSRNNATVVYPNPVESVSFLEYELSENQNISIDLYDFTGKLVHRFMQNSLKSSGKHKETLNLEGYQKGQYIIKMSNNQRDEYAIKIILK